MKIEDIWLIIGVGILIGYGVGELFNIWMLKFGAFALVVVMITAVFELHLDLVKKLSDGQEEAKSK